MCNSKILLLALCLFLFYYLQTNKEHFDTNTAFMKQKGDVTSLDYKGDYTAEQLAKKRKQFNINDKPILDANGNVIVRDILGIDGNPISKDDNSNKNKNLVNEPNIKQLTKPIPIISQDNTKNTKEQRIDNPVPIQPTPDNLNQLIMLNAEKIKQPNKISKASWDLLVAQPSNVVEILQSNIQANSIPLPTPEQYPTLLSQLQLKVATLEYKYNKMIEEQNKYHKLTHNQYNTQIGDITNTYNKQLENQKNELISIQQKISNANGNQFSKMLTELNSQVHNDMNKLREDLLASDRYKNFDNTGSWIK
jgi:outer membrane murein-binding lipoprotein Lpp